MANNNIGTIDASEVFSNRVTMTVKVKGLRRFAWRVKIATFLFSLAGRVLGCPVEVTMVETRTEPEPTEDFASRWARFYAEVKEGDKPILEALERFIDENERFIDENPD